MFKHDYFSVFQSRRVKDIREISIYRPKSQKSIRSSLVTNLKY